MHLFGRRSKEKKDSKNVKIPIERATENFVLGIPLKEAVQNDRCFDGIDVPAVVRHCIDYVMSNGMELEGIYRISPNKSRLDDLEFMVNNGDRRNPPNFSDAHEAAGLLKRFLRQLPEHILTPMLRPLFDATISKCTCTNEGYCSCSVIGSTKELLRNLPHENYCLLAYVFRHAQLIIEKHKSNKMGLAALGVLLQAMFDLTRNEVRIFILNASPIPSNSKDSYIDGDKPFTSLFTDIEFKRYVRPRTLAELRSKLPDNIEQLEDEVKKQNNVLNHLKQQSLKTSTMSLSEKNEISEREEALVLLLKKLASLKGLALEETTINNNVVAISNGIDLVPANFGYGNDEFSVPSNHNELAGNPIFLEKQLLALQTSLKDEIAEEKRKIAQLLSRLREIQSQLPPTVTKELHLARHKRTASSVSSISASTLQSTSSTDNIIERCAAEERRRDGLQSEVVRLRNLCAELRAHLEYDTSLLNNVRVAADASSQTDTTSGVLTLTVPSHSVDPRSPSSSSPSKGNSSLTFSKSSPRKLISPSMTRIAPPPEPAISPSKNGADFMPDESAHSPSSSNLLKRNSDVIDSVESNQQNDDNVTKITKADMLLITRF